MALAFSPLAILPIMASEYAYTHSVAELFWQNCGKRVKVGAMSGNLFWFKG